MPRKSVRSESIEYKGITFRRYPDSKRASDRRYFRPNGTLIKAGVEALHREIWRDNFGEIPEGHDVHHKNNNTADNSIGNLECLPMLVHQKIPKNWNLKEMAENLSRIRHLAAPWHSTEEGLKWHAENARQAYAKREYKNYTCEICKIVFQSRDGRGARFCSGKCSQADRRARKVDWEKRNCERCGTEFECNKYFSTRFCSGNCATSAQHENKRAGLQSGGIR